MTMCRPGARLGQDGASAIWMNVGKYFGVKMGLTRANVSLLTQELRTLCDVAAPLLTQVRIVGDVD